MDISDLQEAIARKRRERGFTHDPIRLQLLLSEELGEVASELKRIWSKNYDAFDPNALADEIADMFVLLSALASEFEIDLEEAVRSKFFTKDESREWKTAPRATPE
jgi:NTP pyrophosphatase (non-canonical NTP hydrolase)